MDLEGVFDALRDIIGRSDMADADFGRLFTRLMRALVRLDDVVVFAYSGVASPIDLYSTFGPVDYHVFVTLYQSGHYILDPFYQTACDRRTGLFRMRDFAPDRFYSSEYYRSYYAKTGLAEEIGFFVPLAGDTTIVLSLMRRKASGPYSQSEITLLRTAEGLVADLVRHVWSAVPNRFEGSSLPQLPARPDDRALSTRDSVWQRLNLTRREAAIVELVLRGHSSESVALRLGITPGTVKVHRRNVYRKLGISSQTQLLAVYLRNDPIGDSNREGRQDDPLYG